jgi:hypothetical protein
MRGLGITLNVVRGLLIVASIGGMIVALGHDDPLRSSATLDALFSVACGVLAVALSPASWHIGSATAPQQPSQQPPVTPPVPAQQPPFPPQHQGQPGPGAHYGQGY